MIWQETDLLIPDRLITLPQVSSSLTILDLWNRYISYGLQCFSTQFFSFCILGPLMFDFDCNIVDFPKSAFFVPRWSNNSKFRESVVRFHFVSIFSVHCRVMSCLHFLGRVPLVHHFGWTKIESWLGKLRTPGKHCLPRSMRTGTDWHCTRCTNSSTSWQSLAE